MQVIRGSIGLNSTRTVKGDELQIRTTHNKSGLAVDEVQKHYEVKDLCCHSNLQYNTQNLPIYTTVAPAAGVAIPLLAPAALAPVPLRYATPSDSSGTVPNTSMSRLLNMDTNRKPANSVSVRLLLAPRLVWFHSAQWGNSIQ